MYDSALRFVRDMKLRELERLRDRLEAPYAQIEETLVEVPTVQDLLALHQRLQRLQLAGRSLHPELESLELLLDVLGSQQRPDSQSVHSWYARVRRSLTQGRARARWVQSFGRVLASMTEPVGIPAPPAKELLQMYQRAPSSGEAHVAILDARIAAFPDRLREWWRASWTKDDGEDPICVRVETLELEGVLTRILEDPSCGVSIKETARAFVSDAALMRELSDAMSLQLEELEHWRWPDPVEAQVVWMRTRWRLRLHEDFISMSLQELISMRLREHFLSPLQGRHQLYRAARLQRLLDLGAPAIIIENERQMLANTQHELSNSDLGVWERALGLLDPSAASASRATSVESHRASIRHELQTVGGSGGYDEDASSALDNILGWVDAELRLASQVWPEHPVWVVKLDIQDFYASIHHAHILDVLTKMGLPDNLRRVLARVLEVPIEGGGHWTRGLPVARGLSRTLAELLMRLLEGHVRDGAQVRILRLVDDICFLTPSRQEAERAWELSLEFLAAFDLEPQVSKCGTLAIGNQEISETLPVGSPRWGMWALDAHQGSHRWSLHQPTLDEFVQYTRARMTATGSVYNAIQEYNQALRRLEGALSLRRSLGRSHRDTLRDALTCFERGVFGPQGALAWCRAKMGEGQEELDEALLYWPRTAGGLGLRHAHVEATRAARACRGEMDPPLEVRAEDWETQNSEWGEWYALSLREIPEVKVESSPQMNALIQDFKARGGEVTGTTQHTLSPYWQVIIGLYGPMILERFGTFRFLLTELVPLRLITHGAQEIAQEDPIPF